MKEEDRRRLVAEWIKYADAYNQGQYQGLCYLLPGTNRKICQHALARVIGKKSYAWRSLCNKVRSGVDLRHGLCGKPGNKCNEKGNDKMREFFDGLLLLGVPRATQVVRAFTRSGSTVTELRDDDDIVDLPPNFTKFGLYKRFLGELGWRIRVDPKNRLIQEYPVDTNKDPLLEWKFVPAWRTFYDYWASQHPRLRIPKASEDICGDCYAFATSALR